jgi:hypothetical protein
MLDPKMPSFVLSQADVTGSEMVILVSNCQNITVGSYKYQLFCQTSTNLNGGCTYLPSQYTSSGSLNCPSLTSQATLQNIYYSTGEACAINCYYPIDYYNIPTFTFPPLPSFTDINFPPPTTTTSSLTPASSTTLPNQNVTGGGNNGGSNSGNTGNTGNTGSGTGTSGTDNGNTGSGNNNGGNGGGGIIVPLVGGTNGTHSGASNAITDPNFMLTFLAIFAIMLLFFRRAI